MIDNNNLEKLKQTQAEIKKDFVQKVVAYITGAFGLVAGLAWNEAITEFITYFFPLQKNTVLAKFIYALIITAVLVLVTFLIMKSLQNKTEKKN